MTASCLPPDAAPPDESNSLDASDIAMLMRSDEEPEPPPPPPEVNIFIACSAAAPPMELALRLLALPSWYAAL